jgi:type IV secretory pathway ATPase VirB11/archaellum biosynthesis ATPase
MEDHGKGQDERKFTVVVNSETTHVTVDVSDPLGELVKKAVKKTDNEAGHPLSDWEVRDQKSGQPLDQAKPIADYDFPDNVTLYIDLKVGGGG